MRAIALLLAFVSSAFAYTVTTPNNTTGWTNVGGQPLVWDRVSTDSDNFTVVLDNQSIPGFSPQVLAALVVGSTESGTMNPPSGGWPTGAHFRINFVASPNRLSTIYAQSVEFSILPPNRTSSSTSSSVLAATPSATVPYSTPVGSSSDTGVVPTAVNSAFAPYSADTGVLALLSLLVYTLA